MGELFEDEIKIRQTHPWKDKFGLRSTRLGILVTGQFLGLLNLDRSMNEFVTGVDGFFK